VTFTHRSTANQEVLDLKTGSIDLESLGWSPDLQTALAKLNDPALRAARVAVETKGSYSVLAPDALTARVSGKLRHQANSKDELPAVGDWVALRPAGGDGDAIIEALLPRFSAFVRKVAGFETEAQVVAANIDVVFVLASVENEPNLRSIERYLTVAWQSGSVPVVVLTKSDVSEDVAGALEAVEGVAPGVAVHAVSAFSGDGLNDLAGHLGPGRTIALLGPSGAGKSTLVNALTGAQLMKVQEVRDYDGKGRHTTTHRELVPLQSGGALIDTPGMRELQLWDSDEGIESTFQDITELASRCKFHDCAHDGEPGCAVKEALQEGALPAERFASFRKQQRELAAIARKKDKRLASLETKKWKKIHREARTRSRERW
jgi:ribosome biogenesis GTPase / thiamine phosphate phosphatase